MTTTRTYHLGREFRMNSNAVKSVLRKGGIKPVRITTTQYQDRYEWGPDARQYLLTRAAERTPKSPEPAPAAPVQVAPTTQPAALLRSLAGEDSPRPDANVFAAIRGVNARIDILMETVRTMADTLARWDAAVTAQVAAEMEATPS